MKIYTLTAFENIKKPDNNKLEKCFEPCQNCKKLTFKLTLIFIKSWIKQGRTGIRQYKHF